MKLFDLPSSTMFYKDITKLMWKTQQGEGAYIRRNGVRGGRRLRLELFFFFVSRKMGLQLGGLLNWEERGGF